MQNGLPYTPGWSGKLSGALGSDINGAGGTTIIPGYIAVNTARYPRRIADDARVQKQFKFERYIQNVQLMLNVFNIANHQNITAVGTTAYTLSGSTLTYLGQGSASPSNNTLGIPTNSNSSGFLLTPRLVASNYTYCYNGTSATDHGVTIVGWDDNKVTPGGTGAWLIKNSWGTTAASWGGVPNDNGYFWLSYNDAYGGATGKMFGESFGNAVPASTYSQDYDWSTFGDVSELNTPYVFNAYTASTNSLLKSVGFFTEAEGASYTVRIYGTYSGGTLSNLLASTTGTETYAGYHTVDLTTPVSLTAGNKFYVYLSIANGGTYPLASGLRGRWLRFDLYGQSGAKLL